MEKKKLPPGILAIQFLVLMSYSSMAVLNLLPLYFEHIGGKPGEIGFYVGLFSFAAFFSRPLGGWLLSRQKPKKILVAGLIVMLGSTISYLFIKRLDWVLGLIRLFHGLGFSLFILAALFMAVMKTQERERAYAIGVISVGFMLPLLVVPLLGEEVIKKFGYFFFFLLAIALAVIPLFYALVRRISLSQPSEREGGKGSSFFHLLRQKRIILIVALTFIFELGLSASLSFVPLLAHSGSSMRAGLYYTFLGLTAGFLRLYAGKKLRFWGSSKLLFPAFIFLFLGGSLTSLSFDNLILSLSGFVWGFGVGILYPHLSALSVEGVNSENRAKALSLFASSVDLGFALGPLTFGWLTQLLGLRRAFFLFALFILFSSLPLVSILQVSSKAKKH
jgi:MFS family permease